MSKIAAKEVGAVFRGGVDAELGAATSRFANAADAAGLIEVGYASFDSPVGVGLLAATRRGLLSVGLPNLGENEFLEQIAATVSPRILERPSRVDLVRRELDEYFAGRRRDFDLELDWRLVQSPFARRVLDATAALPYGVTASYGEIAARAGNERAFRAAGTALGHNPIPIVVPCHRVLRARGVLGNYGGGPEMKAYLLRLEGALN